MKLVYIVNGDKYRENNNTFIFREENQEESEEPFERRNLSEENSVLQGKVLL